MDLQEYNRTQFFMNLPSGTFKLGSQVKQLNIQNLVRASSNSHNLFALFPDLDNFLGQINEGDLIVVGARKGVGKTSFGTTLTHFAAQNLSKVCFVAFFDTDFIDYSQRFLVTEARSSISQLFLGSIFPGERDKILDAEEKLLKLPITLYSDPKASLEKLNNEILAWSESHGQEKKFVFVDTIQFLAFMNASSPPIKEVARRLKTIARATNSILVFTTNVVPSTPENRTPTIEDFEEGKEFFMRLLFFVINTKWVTID